MGFLEPLALTFSALYGVLVLFYLRERWRRREIVPSLLLWRTLRQDAVRGRRFVPDLLFYLRFLVLTLLIAALARPYVSDGRGGPGGGRRIIVLDTSASMQAEEPLGTRFEQARQRAREIIREAPPDEQIMLLHGGRTPAVAADFTLDRARLLRVLRDSRPSDTGADIGLALHFAENARTRSDLPTEIDVLTDIPHAELPEPLRDRVNVIPFGESDENVGIEALQVSQGRFQGPLAAHAYVVVENFAHVEQHSVLTVLLDDVVVQRKGFTLAARTSQGFLLGDFERSGLLTARLEGGDALSADDVARSWIRPVRPADVLLVSPASPLVRQLREVAAASAAVRLTVVDPDEFEAKEAGRFHVTIYHGFVPASWEGSNALFIYPPPGNPLLPVAGEAEAVEVLDWNERHPALRSLRPLAAVPVRRARMVTPPAWAETLLVSRTPEREFPLAFAGEQGGRRLACFAFDLADERLLAPDSTDLLLLLMSVLSWLTPDADEVLVVRTGEVTRVDGKPSTTGTLLVRGPRGDRYELPAEAPFFEPMFAGAYAVGTNGSSATVLANFFDPEESDIGRATSDETRAASQARRSTAAGPKEGGAEYAAWLFALAALFLLVEWGVAER